MFAVQVQRSISMLLLIALLAWSAGGVCAPVPSMHGMQCLMGSVEPLTATHACCPPENRMAMSCHGKRNDAMTRCATMADDEAVLTTAKYRDDGLRQAAASSSAAVWAAASPELGRMRSERMPLLRSRAVLDVKADLRI
jgi:hypothetical protein